MIVRWAAVTETDPASYAYTPWERGRADAFRFPADHDAYLAAHGLVRECAATLLGTDPAGLVLRQRCPDCAAETHGRPYIEGSDAYVSLSHTRGYVAASAAYLPVGVDIEAATVTDVPDTVFAPAEHGGSPLLRLHRWVLKESLIKVGATRLDELRDVDLSHVTGAGEFRWGAWVLRTELVDDGKAVLGSASV